MSAAPIRTDRWRRWAEERSGRKAHDEGGCVSCVNTLPGDIRKETQESVSPSRQKLPDTPREGIDTTDTTSEPLPPAALFRRAWDRALAEARGGFAERGTDPDPASLEAAASLLCDLDPSCPEGERTHSRRQHHEETCRLVLDELYRGVAVAELQANGEIRVVSRSPGAGDSAT